MNGRGVLRRVAALAAALAVVAAAAEPPAVAGRTFGPPERVTILGYEGDAMEPFVTRDGRYLLFNNRNDPGVDTNLHFARRVDDLTFAYGGEVAGTSSPALDAVPSVDRDGWIYFISTRSYASTRATLYRARLRDGQVGGLELLRGVAPRRPGIVTFDAEVSADGNTLFIVDGLFTGGSAPRSADIAIAVRDGKAFHRRPSSTVLLAEVNVGGLNYAPAVSGDLLELFFTRAAPGRAPAVWRAVRRRADEPFGVPEPVAAITGFAEAPALSADGRALYYHKLEGGRFAIFRVAR